MYGKRINRVTSGDFLKMLAWSAVYKWLVMKSSEPMRKQELHYLEVENLIMYGIIILSFHPF